MTLASSPGRHLPFSPQGIGSALTMTMRNCMMMQVKIRDHPQMEENEGERPRGL